MTKAKPSAPKSINPNIDLNAVWEKFIQKSHWDEVSEEAQKILLQSKRERIGASIEALRAQYDLITEQIDSVEDRESNAKVHLTNLATALGPLATEKVLITAMLEHYGTIRTQSSTEKKPKTTTIISEDAVLNVLDYDGKFIHAIVDDLKDEYPEASVATTRLVIQNLIAKGAVIKTGERRSSQYRRAQEV